MELTLEIAEGSKYNNLINEIETEFEKAFSKALYYKNNYEYEKTIQYMNKCILIDPDNKDINHIKKEFKFYLNKYFYKLYELGHLNYYHYELDISKYYLTKCYCLIKEYEKYINPENIKCFDQINNMLIFIEDKRKYYNNYNVKDIQEIKLENIKI